MAQNTAVATGAGSHALTQWSGAVIGIVLPLAMFLANRSAAFVLVVAALLALAGLWQAGRLGDLGRLLAWPWPPAALVGAAFVGLAALSLGWSVFPKSGAFGLGEFCIPLAAAITLGLAWRIAPPRHVGLLLAGGLALAAMASMADLATGMAFRKALGIRPQLFVLNRTVVAQLVLLWPMLALIGRRYRAVGWATAALVAAAMFVSESGSAKLGVLAGATVMAIAIYAPRLATGGVAIGTTLLLLIQPWLGRLVAAVMPARVNAAMADAHSNDRINIWSSFGAAVEQHPLVGSGFNASARMADNPLVQRVPEPLREMLGAGHPHNSFLQIWVDLGAVGAILAIALVLLACLTIYQMSQAARPYAAGLAASVLSIAAVSHGAWQAWWIACVGAAVVLFLSVRDRTDERI